jgi:alanyl-tRNA synthetase
MKSEATQQVNYQDAYLREIRAAVTAVVPVGKEWAVVLDRTIFYPEGGGQPGDRGSVGGVPVRTTRIADGLICHITANRPALEPGESVSCLLDWEHRFDYMQQHTGQHILSGVLYRLLNIQTVSVHQGESWLTIETDRKEITQAEIEAVEDEANSIICENIPVTAVELNEEEVRKSSLRREPKVSGLIRLVKIGDRDIVACGGMHTARSGEVRLVHWIGSETIRGHIRLYWKVGNRAAADYRSKTALAGRLIDLYSVPLEGVAAEAERKLEQIRELRQQLQGAEGYGASLLMRMFLDNAELCCGVRIAAADLSDEPRWILSRLADALPEEPALVLCAVQKVGEGDLRWFAAANREHLIRFDEFKRVLFPVIEAKGGGRPPVWQGKGSLPDRSGEFLAAFRKFAAESCGRADL